MAHDTSHWWLEILTRQGETLSLFEPESFSVTVRLNAASSMSGVIAADSTGAQWLSVYERVIQGFRRPRAGGARVRRFAGHVHPPVTDSGDADGLERVDFIAYDPFAALAHRYLWSTHGYTGFDAGVIAADLNSRAREYEWPLGTPVPPTSHHGLTVDIIQATVNRDRTYEPAKQIAEAITQLAEVQNGFWFRVDAPAGALSVSNVGRLHLLAAPGIARTEVPLEFGPGTRNNIASYRVDTLGVTNGVTALGADGLFTKVYDSDSIAQYGLWETVVSFPDVSNSTTLLDHAAEALRPDPAQSFAVELADTGDNAPPVPELWEEFLVGDSLPLYIRGQRVTVERLVTVTEATVAVDENGVERLSNLVLEAT